MNDDISPEAREAAEINLTEFDGITPGEWFVQTDFDNADRLVLHVWSKVDGKTAFWVCSLNRVEWYFAQERSEQVRADARAIAAVPKLIRALDAQTKELARLREENERLKDALNWQNVKNKNPAPFGAFEFYINEEWTGIARVALDSEDATSIATLAKRRYDPDDERVRVRRVNADDALIADNDSLRAESERLTRERDEKHALAVKHIEVNDRLLLRIATLEQQVSDERNLGDCLASALLGDFPARGALERYRDAVHEDSREEVQERIDAYFNTAATNKGGSEG